METIFHDSSEIGDFNLDETTKQHLDRIVQSDIYILLYTGKRSPQMAMELGTAIFFNKPIGILAKKGVAIPSQLFKVADEIVSWEGEFDIAPQSMKLYQLLTERLNNEPLNS